MKIIFANHRGEHKVVFIFSIEWNRITRAISHLSTALDHLKFLDSPPLRAGLLQPMHPRLPRAFLLPLKVNEYEHHSHSKVITHRISKAYPLFPCPKTLILCSTLVRIVQFVSSSNYIPFPIDPNIPTLCDYSPFSSYMAGNWLFHDSDSSVT